MNKRILHTLLLVSLSAWLVCFVPQSKAQTKLNKKDRKSLQAIIDSYGGYIKECHNDSMLTEKHRIVSLDMCAYGWKCITPEHWHYVWEHRSPTLEGYMEYLKKRCAPR